MKNNLDCLFVHSDSSAKAYQSLSGKYSGIEPPTWSLLLAESCRSKGFRVGILDCCAENLGYEQASKRIQEINAKVTLFVVYGQNPNAGTTSMIGATGLAKCVYDSGVETKIGFVGSHVSAFPKSVLELNYIDFVLLNEGVYALWNLLKTDLAYEDLRNIKGIGWKDNDKNIIINKPEGIVPQERMDIDLPGYAWDLLPMKKKSIGSLQITCMACKF